MSLVGIISLAATLVCFAVVVWCAVDTNRSVKRSEAAARRSQRAEVESGAHLIRAQARARLRS